MRVAMIGTGYVGLVSGACFSEFGVSVVCVDQDAEKIARLERGEMPIFEPGLEQVEQTTAGAGGLSFTTDVRAAINGAGAVFIAVGTPSRRGDGHADLSHVFAAAEEIGRALAENGNARTVVITKSTVPVGTGRRVERILAKALPAQRFDVASNPEFLREGSAIQDFMRPDRVVIGTESAHAREVLSGFYRPLYLLETPMVFTSVETAELIKYAANAFLHSSRPRSPSSTRWRICARRSAPMFRMSRAALASMAASAANSCMPGRALAARAFRRTAPPWCAPPRRPRRPLRIVDT